MFKKTSDYKSGRVVCLVHGESGTGKTFSSTTLPGKVCIINAESGLRSVVDHDIDVYDLTLDKEGNPLPRNRRFEKLMYALEHVFPETNYDWLVFDSITEICQNLVEFLKVKYPDRSDGLKMWGEYNESFTMFIKELRDYAPFNILMLALSAADKDESGRRFTGVDINGKISSRIPALVDEVFHLKVFVDEDGNDQRKFITQNYNNIIAKDRSGKLDRFEDVDFAQIIKKIKGE